VKVSWLSGGLCLAVLASAACAGPTRERETVRDARSQGTARADEADRARTAERAPTRKSKKKSAPAPIVDPLQLAANDSAPRASTAVADPTDRAARHEKSVAVQGIEGTLSNFDVRVTMEKHGKAFASCHEPRARKVPALAGAVEFRIHVLQSGDVSDVHVRVSDLGDRVLERCLSEVIQAAKFPQPHGGEADVTWNMLLEPTRKGHKPEQWDTERVERVLRKHGNELIETCDAKRAGAITITAYVSRSGRVLAAGVATTAVKESSPEQFDCIAEELRSWPMPKPRKGTAKVSFPLRTGA
jgi:hypothetical protein